MQVRDRLPNVVRPVSNEPNLEARPAAHARTSQWSGIMQDKSSQSTATARTALDEFQLRDELRTLRARIPDEPQLNPILNVAFDLSRRLEAGQIDFTEFKALAGRLMDRAAARRAIRLRDRIGHADTTATLKEFASFVEASLPRAAMPAPVSPRSRRDGIAPAPASCSPRIRRSGCRRR